MENTKVNRRDHGTWSKHLTCHYSIYIILFPIKYAETVYVLVSTEICMLPTTTVERKEKCRLAWRLPLCFLTNPLCVK